MKAMILAAGLGTRLKPFTNNTPKALVPILGTPVIEHVILKLKSQGFNEIIINIHHFADQIINFIKSKKYFDIRIEFSDEREKLLDTGGAIKKASAHCPRATCSTFHVLGGSNISRITGRPVSV